eukprot:TRINITY_DN431_c0_g1_i1.p1 TRINITY_DN431_c0_g1~~TRINITY_DN431_c0_g1_i1.p1  ORF type:complete len:577 (-),score=183.58 TRINITY_DN431_c0_g1_i1:35-1765(-)
MITDFLYLEDDGKKVDIYPGDNTEGLRINSTGEVELFTPSQENLPNKNRNSIFMIIGIIDIFSTTLLISVTQKNLIAKIDGKQIWKIQGVSITPIGASKDSNGELQKYIELLTKLLGNGEFYYSHTYDLTNSWQRQKNNKSPEIDERFYWNRFVHKRFENIPKNHKIRNFLSPIIQGFVELKELKIQGKQADFVLLSRRSCKRTGVRYESRGSNLEGDASNFVETEQILSVGEGNNLNITSFLQVRGSIPIIWQQKTNVKYDPPIIVDDVNQSKRAFNNHFDEQLKLYKKQTVVSLIKEKGTEKKLGDAFNSMVEQYKNENLHYNTFDLHRVCGTTKFEKLSILFDKIDSDLDSYAFYCNGKNSSEQGGIVRTNCKDSLDRTNLVQSKIALKIFWRQAQALGLVKDTQPDPEVESTLRHIWADHGDALSIQYAGTPAVRGDVTRTGKGSIKGLINDGLNSITRYYLNNFQDGSKQDSIDLFLGKTKFHTKKTIEPQPQDKGGFLLMFIATLLFLFHLSKPTPTNAGSLNFVQYLLLLIWLPIIFIVWLVSSLFNKKIGYRMTSKPVLTDHINDYEK